MNSLIMLLIVFVLLVAALAVIMRFVKNLARIIIVVVLLVLVFFAGIYVLRDAAELQKEFLPGEKLLVLDLSGNVVAATVSKGTSAPEPVAGLDNLDLLYSEGDFSEMRGENYKLVIFKWSAFAGIDFVGSEKFRFSMDETKQIMESSAPRDLLVNKMVKDQGEIYRDAIRSEVFKEFPADEHLCSVLFGFMIAEFIGQDSVFEEYVNGNVLIYPETITLKIIKVIPFSWMKGFLPENNLR